MGNEEQQDQEQEDQEQEDQEQEDQKLETRRWESSTISRHARQMDSFKGRTAVKSEDSAGVTQLVECHLAKVDVESSNLFSRSKSDPTSSLEVGFLRS
jgi:hypothetical protein